MASKKKTEETPKLMATVKGSLKLNIRSGKTKEDDNIVGTLNPGDKVEILKDGKLWCQIDKGYVMREFLSFD